MSVSLTPLDPTGTDREALIAFLTENTFPFHVRSQIRREYVVEAIERGVYDDDENKTFWLQTEDGIHVGIVRLEDFEDPTPLFDLRLGENHRGLGLGAEALRAITQYVFMTWPGVNRFEGQTREDNLAMRRIFLRQGWLKEAHYREGWPVEGGEPVASVAYAVLRRDWERGEITRFDWEDVTL